MLNNISGNLLLKYTHLHLNGWLRNVKQINKLLLVIYIHALNTCLEEKWPLNKHSNENLIFLNDSYGKSFLNIWINFSDN